ncbi:MAG TPA: HD domain-containing phosphohydrolase [Gaiellaceae bacterium]|jgi:diguanylate cyclase (GGDEF)-like protein
MTMSPVFREDPSAPPRGDGMSIPSGLRLFEVKSRATRAIRGNEATGHIAAGLLSEARVRSPVRSTRRKILTGVVAAGGCFAVAAALLMTGESWPRVPIAAFLPLVAVFAALARERRQRFEAQIEADELDELAHRDPLTQLGNRRKLDSDIRAAERHQSAWLLAVFDLDGFKIYNDTHGHPAGDALLRRLGHRLQTVAGDCGYRMGGDEFCVLAPLPDNVDAFLLRCTAALTEIREGDSIFPSRGAASSADDTRDFVEALRLADARLYDQKAARRTERHSPQAALLQALLERDPTQYWSTRNVAKLAVSVAERLGLSAEELPDIRAAALLRDVGKLSLPDAILRKRGKLDEDDWAAIREHTLAGQRILSASDDLVRAAEIVRSTYERWDGQGYPDGLAGAEIPVEARIIAVCGAFDAITTDSVYRGRRTIAAARIELVRCAGTQFDPRVVAAILELTDEADLEPSAPVRPHDLRAGSPEAPVGLEAARR